MYLRHHNVLSGCGNKASVRPRLLPVFWHEASLDNSYRSVQLVAGNVEQRRVFTLQKFVCMSLWPILVPSWYTTVKKISNAVV